MALGLVGLGLGFVGFLAQLRGAEVQARPQCRRHRGADRRLVAGLRRDRLLAAGYGKRLLISRRASAPTAPARSRGPLPDSQSLLDCCVDLDRSAVNTLSNAAETRRWAQERGFRSLIVVTSNYHMPRAIAELSHAMPDVELIPFAVVSDMARRAVVDQWRDVAAAAIGIRNIVAAEARVRLAGLGHRLGRREPKRRPNLPRRPSRATALAN